MRNLESGAGRPKPATASEKMPTQAVAAETMEVGHHGSGKHWTKAEKAAREAAAAEIARKEPVKLEPPDWLSKEARRVWRKIVKNAADVNLLDILDENTLAVYCNAVVEYRKCAQELGEDEKKSLDAVKEQQAWARVITSLSDKLGLNPSARARLVKKKAEAQGDDFGNEFD